MAGRTKRKSSMNKDAWLATYADMITLVLVFFILLYSMSTIDQEKFQMLVKAFTADPETIEKIRLLESENELDAGKPDPEEGGIKGDNIGQNEEVIDDLDALYEYLEKYVEENQLQESVQVEKGKDMVYIRFMSTLFFEADRAALKSGGQSILSYVGDALGQIEPYIKFIRIDGHTAEAAPGSSSADDRLLSTDRANMVLKYLEANYIDDPAKLIAVGYGMYRPVAPNDTEANRAKNRRVEILIAKSDSLQDELDKIYDLADDLPAAVGETEGSDPLAGDVN